MKYLDVNLFTEDGASSEGPLETIKRILEKEGLEGLYR